MADLHVGIFISLSWSIQLLCLFSSITPFPRGKLDIHFFNASFRLRAYIQQFIVPGAPAFVRPQSFEQGAHALVSSGTSVIPQTARHRFNGCSHSVCDLSLSSLSRCFTASQISRLKSGSTNTG